MRRVRLSDVAAAAGVSSATASMVLNGKDASIGESARGRVLEAAVNLGYRPNALARGLRGQRTFTVGFLSHDVATTPFAGELIQGAQEVANAHDYVLLIGNTGVDADVDKRTVEAMLDRQIDGVIYARMYHEIIQPLEALASVPTVVLNSQSVEGSWVAPDEEGGTRAAIGHLVSAGHRRIGYLCTSETTPAATERADAYRSIVEELGLDSERGLVAAAASGTTADAMQAATRLLTQPHGPTALFCYNDRMAAAAFNAARRLGLSIPQDLSIVGFDNQVLVAEAVDPGLTSVQLPHEDMGRWAMEHLLHLLDGRTATASKRMPCPLVERSSVAPPSKQFQTNPGGNLT